MPGGPCGVDDNLGYKAIQQPADSLAIDHLVSLEMLKARAGGCESVNRTAIEPDDTTRHAAVLMIHGGFRHLPVVERDDVVGILSIRDLMRVALEDSAPRGV